MEELLTNAFNTGDLKIIIAALLVYCVIYWQRKDTKKHRDTAHDDLQTRIALLENEMKQIKQLDLDARLAAIETSLKYIEKLLEDGRK